MRRFMGSYHGTQTGDPAKAADAIVRAVCAPKPPLRLPLGPDAVDVVRKKLASVQENLETWLDVSSGTNFDD
jgi:hypothetical protein